MTQTSFRPHDRLRSRADYDQVFARAQRTADRYFTVLTRFSDLGHSRLGLAVSRKVNKRAHVRNRLKRVVRESFRSRRWNLKPMDIVVIPRPAAASADNPTLFAALDRLWSRLPQITADHR